MSVNRCRVAFFVSGAGRIARAAIEDSQRLGIDAVLLAAEERAASDLESFCREHGVPMVRLPAARAELDRALIDACRAAKPDLIVLSFDKLVPREIVDAFPGRILNLHMGPLPATAGLHPLRKTLELGLRAGGATVHEVTNGIDSGPVVASVDVPVEPGDTVETLGARVYPFARQLLLDAIETYARRSMLVTTIIPVRNRAALLREAVASVLAQTHRPIEIVIVDDGSTDETRGTADALAHTHECIRVVHQPNGGPGTAREAGRRVATGAFVQYLDSDDVLLPRKFELQVAGLREHPECGASYGWTRIRFADGSTGERPWKRTGERHAAMFPTFLEDRWWDTSTPLFRREVTVPWTALRVEEDWEHDAHVASRGTRLHFVEDWVSETRQLDPARLSLVGGADVLRDRATAHTLIYEHATRAGIAHDAPEMQRFARELFHLARQCGAAALATESRALTELAARISNARDLRVYQALAKTIGWRAAGTASMWIDRLRGPRA